MSNLKNTQNSSDKILLDAQDGLVSSYVADDEVELVQSSINQVAGNLVGVPWPTIEKLWSETVRARLYSSYCEKGKVQEYLNRFPVVKGSEGWRLLIQDFEALCPAAEDGLATCKEFMPKILCYAEKNSRELKDKLVVATIKKIREQCMLSGEINRFGVKESRTSYSVTVSKKPSLVENPPLCSGQQSFISIHSTDHLCQLSDIETSNLAECNIEILSLNEVFPSNSDESLSNDESPVRKRSSHRNKLKTDNLKALYVPSNSKSSTMSGRQKDVEAQPSGYSTVDIPKNTLYVIGSNPGEPKMSYPDPPKKISKTMKKFLRNIDKHKNEQSKGEKAISKLTTMRGILKDGRCGPECTGDSVQGEDYTPEDLTLPFPMDFGPHSNYAKQNPDKNVTFNTQVVIIHFTGDLCVGQSVETLSKEKDQQARNSELRKTFLTKYNEFWPTQK